MPETAGMNASLTPETAYQQAIDLSGKAASALAANFFLQAGALNIQAKTLMLQSAEGGYAPAFYQAGVNELETAHTAQARRWFEAVRTAYENADAGDESLRSDAAKATAKLEELDARERAAAASVETTLAQTSAAAEGPEPSPAEDPPAVTGKQAPVPPSTPQPDSAGASDDRVITLPPSAEGADGDGPLSQSIQPDNTPASIPLTVPPLTASGSSAPVAEEAKGAPRAGGGPAALSPEAGAQFLAGIMTATGKRGVTDDPFHEENGNTFRLTPSGARSGAAGTAPLPADSAATPTSGSPSPIVPPERPPSAAPEFSTRADRQQAIADIISWMAGSADATIQKQIGELFEKDGYITTPTLSAFAAGLKPEAGEPEKQADAPKYVRAVIDAMPARDKARFILAATQAAEIIATVITDRIDTVTAMRKYENDRGEGQRIADEWEGGNLVDVHSAVAGNQRTDAFVSADYRTDALITVTASKKSNDDPAHYVVRIIGKPLAKENDRDLNVSEDGRLIEFTIPDRRAFIKAIELLREEGPAAFQRELENQPTIQRIRLKSGVLCDIQTVGGERSIIWTSANREDDQRLRAGTVQQSDDGLSLSIAYRGQFAWKQQTETVAAPLGIAIGAKEAMVAPDNAAERAGFTKEDIIKYEDAKKVLENKYIRRRKITQKELDAASDILLDLGARGLAEAQLACGWVAEQDKNLDVAKVYYDAVAAKAGRPDVNGAVVQQARIRLAAILIDGERSEDIPIVRALMEQAANKEGIRKLPEAKDGATRRANKLETAGVSEWAYEAQRWMKETNTPTRVAPDNDAEIQQPAKALAKPTRRSFLRAGGSVLVRMVVPVGAAGVAIAVLDGPDNFEKTRNSGHILHRLLGDDPSKTAGRDILFTNEDDLTAKITATVEAGRVATFRDNGMRGERFIVYQDPLAAEIYLGVVRREGVGLITTDIGRANGDPDFVGNIAALAADRGDPGLLSKYVEAVAGEPGAVALKGEQIMRVTATLEPKRPVVVHGHRLQL